MLITTGAISRPTAFGASVVSHTSFIWTGPSPSGIYSSKNAERGMAIQARIYGYIGNYCLWSLDAANDILLAYVSGYMRKHFIRDKFYGC